MCNEQIRVSVIMPVYNEEEFLRPALDSVIAQTLGETEIICIDDGSTDRSLEILKEYQEKDARIRIVTEVNAGPARARNSGIERARGDYLAFLDADDFYEPEFLERLYTLAVEKDLDIAISGYDHYVSKKSQFRPAPRAEHADIYHGGVVTSKNEHPDVILSSAGGSAWNKLFRRSFVIDKELSFLTDVKIFEDVYFVDTALSLAERISKDETILLHHRIHSEQSRQKMFREHYDQVPFVYEKVKESLMHRGMYLPLSVSFLNLTTSRCYKIYNLLGMDEKRAFWQMLHGGVAERLGWYAIALDRFESPEVCTFVANIHAYDHERYLRRLSKGLSYRWRKLTASLAEQSVFKRKKKK